MEYVIVNEEHIACSHVSTGIQSISFTVENGDIASLKEKMVNVTELSVSAEIDGDVYGEYADLSFESATVYEDETVTVVMHIATAEEKRLSALEVSQAEQDIVIAKSMFGGESE